MNSIIEYSSSATLELNADLDKAQQISWMPPYSRRAMNKLLEKFEILLQRTNYRMKPFSFQVPPALKELNQQCFFNKTAVYVGLPGRKKPRHQLCRQYHTSNQMKTASSSEGKLLSSQFLKLLHRRNLNRKFVDEFRPTVTHR